MATTLLRTSRCEPSGARLPRLCIETIILFLVFFFVVALLAPPGVYAQETGVTLDPGQTRIEYTLGATLHEVHGTFKLKSGVVRFDPATGKAGGAIVVDATSGNSGNDGRDSKMHREILESAKYPEIVFMPSRVKGVVNAPGASQVEVSGIFRLHGQDHDLTIPLALQVTGSQATASAHFSVPYQNWGLKNPSTFILRVKDTVQIEVEAIGHLTAAPTK
jgi:polyisoprenoid-binding protein YceI